MATPVFCCGFECGTLQANGVGNIGEHWAVTGTSSITIATATKRTANRSLQFTNLNSSTYATPAATVHATINVARFYVYFSSVLPNVDVRLYQAQDGSTFVGSVYFQTSDSKIYAARSAGAIGASGVTVIPDRWYCIDVKITCNANPWTTDVMVDGVACGQYTNAVAATTATIHRFGQIVSGTSTVTYFIDDVTISNTSADYPLGPGAIIPLVPTADGTHNVAGTADFRRTLTATDILNATTTAFQLVDDVPLESGASVDWINMLAPVNATDYVECIFGPASGFLPIVVAPRTIEVIAAIHQAATTTGNMEIRINDNGTMNAMYTATAVAGVTTIVYKRKHYATAIAGGGAWVVGGGGNGDITDLRVRFGSPAVLDVVPDQYFDCIMIEAEFPEPKQKVVSINQSVNRSNTY